MVTLVSLYINFRFQIKSFSILKNKLAYFLLEVPFKAKISMRLSKLIYLRV